MIFEMCESVFVSCTDFFYMISCRQLLYILDLFSPTDICEHLSPIAIALAEDRVAQVRLEALKVVRTALLFCVYSRFGLLPNNALTCVIFTGFIVLLIDRYSLKKVL